MRNLILFLLLLTSCSIDKNSTYWNENLNSDYEDLKYDKDYTFDEYNKILDKYSDRKRIPNLN